jgi:hypothetical protein
MACVEQRCEAQVPMMRCVCIFIALLLACCGPTPLALNDAGPRPLFCATPMRIDLVAPTTGTNAGIPMASIAWPGDHCVLTDDEHAPGLVLLLADFSGTVFGPAALTVSPGSDWRIDSSSPGGGGPSPYLSNQPRDTDITVTLHDGTETDRVSVTFRVEGNTLVLLDMHRI